MIKTDINKQKLTDEDLAQASGGESPLIELVPLPALIMDEAAVGFQMEVNNSGSANQTVIKAPGQYYAVVGKVKSLANK